MLASTCRLAPTLSTHTTPSCRRRSASTSRASRSATARSPPRYSCRAASATCCTMWAWSRMTSAPSSMPTRCEHGWMDIYIYGWMDTRVSHAPLSLPLSLSIHPPRFLSRSRARALLSTSLSPSLTTPCFHPYQARIRAALNASDPLLAYHVFDEMINGDEHPYPTYYVLNP